MSKRPQRSSGQMQSYGVPEQATTIQASPVNTFVAPGREGMPVAPTQSAMPVQPSNQAAIDMQNLSRSFVMLSSAIGQLGQAQAKGDKAMLEWGADQAELVDLKKSQHQTELAFSEAVDQGYVDAVDHPAASKGLARGLARRIAHEMDLNYEANWERWGLEEPEFQNGEWMRNKYDKDTQSVLDNVPKGIANPTIFQHEFTKARSRQRAKWSAKHDDWMNKLVMQESERGIQTTVLDLAKEALNLERDPGVVYNIGKDKDGNEVSFGPPTIVPESDEDYRKRQIEFFNKEVLALLDGETGQPFVPRVVNEIVGRSFVDSAVNATSPSEAQFMMDALKSQMTGPPNSRGNLLSGATQIYFEENEKRILSNIQTRTTAANNRAFRAAGDVYVDSLVQTWQSRLAGDQTGMADGQITRMLGDDLIPTGGVTEIEGVGILRKTGPDQFTLYPGESTGADQPYTFTGSEITKRAIDLDYDDRVRYHRDGQGESEPIALTKAMVDQQRVRPEVQDRLQALPRLISSARQQHDALAGNMEEWDSPHLKDMQDAFEMYKTTMELAPYLLREMLPDNSPARATLELIDTIRTSEVVGRATGGSDWPEIYRALVEIGDEPISQSQFEKDWKAVDNDFRTNFRTQLSNIDGLSVVDIRRVGARIERSALALYQLGIMEPQQAIDAAIQNYEANSVIVGSSRVLKEDAPPPALLNGVGLENLDVEFPTRFEEGAYGWLPLNENERQKFQTFMRPVDSPLDTMSAILDGVGTYLTEDGVSLKEAMGRSFSQWAFQGAKELAEGLPGPKTLNLNEVIELAEQRFLDNHGPDRTFFENNQMMEGVEKVRFAMTEGHAGLLYDVEIYSPSMGQWVRTDTSLSLQQVVAYSKRDAPVKVGPGLIGVSGRPLSLIPEGMERGKDYFFVPMQGFYSREQMKNYSGDINKYIDLSIDLRREDGERVSEPMYD